MRQFSILKLVKSSRLSVCNFRTSPLTATCIRGNKNAREAFMEGKTEDLVTKNFLILRGTFKITTGMTKSNTITRAIRSRSTPLRARTILIQLRPTSICPIPMKRITRGTTYLTLAKRKIWRGRSTTTLVTHT